MTSQLPRGIRNHNPGNIEYSPRNQWQGQIGSDGRFAIFSAPEYGIRAIVRLLITYQRKYRLMSVQEMIQRWAPPHENHTQNYINRVCKTVGVHPKQTVSLQDPAVAAALVRAIVAVENGNQYFDYYDQETLQKGLALAGVNDSAASSLLQSKRTITATAGVAGTLAGTTAAVDQINTAVQQMTALGGTAAQMASRLSDAKAAIWALAAIALVGFSVIIYLKWREARGRV